MRPPTSPSATKRTRVPSPSGSNDHSPSTGYGPSTMTTFNRPGRWGRLCELLHLELRRLPFRQVRRVRDVVEYGLGRLANHELLLDANAREIVRGGSRPLGPEPFME